MSQAFESPAPEGPVDPAGTTPIASATGNLRPVGGYVGRDAPAPADLLNCMRCGMCLPVCPTYQLTGRERSSPRGRIALMRAVSEGDLPLESPVLAQEMDFCLGCLACTTACPAGVDYASLLEAARDQLAHRPRPWWRRLARRAAMSLFERPGRLRGLAVLLRLYQRSGLAWLARRTGILRAFRLEDAEGMLPTVPWRPSHSLVPPVAGAGSTRVGMLLGCVMDVLFVEENLATVEVLVHHGCQVVTPPGQGCCGALHAHAGDLEGARALARHNIEQFERAGVELVAVNSAGCGACMKHYPRLLEGDPEWAAAARRFSQKVRDVHELLVERGFPPVAQEADPTGRAHGRQAGPSPRITYHDACHLAHGQGITRQPRQLVRALGDYVELPRGDRCCGSAGVYNLTQPETADQLLEDKLDAIESTGAEVVAVANPGCLLQIRQGLKRRGSAVRAEHPMVLLARAWRAPDVHKQVEGCSSTQTLANDRA